ncbi:MAG: hypothetical protein WKG00_02295 [Polyangiaceae bacterium]
MPSLDDIADHVRDAAGADFAFVLTKRGRLVTANAPRDMPELGRARLVGAAMSMDPRQVRGLLAEPRQVRGLLPRASAEDHASVVEVTLPREQLVRFGGAAPVDVFVGVAADQAVLCVVMASWADKRPVLPAVDAALDALEALLDGGSIAKAQRGAIAARDGAREPARRGTSAAPSPPKRGASTKPRRRGAMTGLVQMSAARSLPPTMLEGPRISSVPPPPVGFRLNAESMPEIVIDSAPVGRETLSAIEADMRAGHAAPETETPEIRIELASIGRNTEMDLRREETRRMHALAAAPPDPLVAPAAHRMTQPWTETPTDAKRAADAARRARRVAPPKVSLKLEEPDGDVLEALLVDDASNSEDDVPTGVARPRVPRPDKRR